MHIAVPYGLIAPLIDVRVDLFVVEERIVEHRGVVRIRAHEARWFGSHGLHCILAARTTAACGCESRAAEQDAPESRAERVHDHHFLERSTARADS